MKKSVLYIQHAPRVGGSVISLKELVIDAIDHKIDCYVVCVNNEVGEFYKSIGAKTFIAPIAVFNHNTALQYELKFGHLLHVFKQCVKLFFSFFYFLKIILQVKPQIVHLNSSTLISYTLFFWLIGIKSVVHIREFIVKGNWGIRKRILRLMLNFFAEKIFYISEIELENLKTKKSKSLIVYNYLHTKDLPSDARKAIPYQEKFKLITLGGIYKIKGGDVLLESFKHLDDRFELQIMGSEDPRKDVFDLIKVEGQDYYNKIMALLNEEEISKKVKFLGRVNDPMNYLRQANALIFWTLSPHFPRPVFEGWLLDCHIIYYNPDFRNTYINTETVNFVNGYEVLDLKATIENLLSNQEALLYKVENGNNIAHRCFTEQNFRAVLNSYNKIFNKYGVYS